MGKYEDRKNMAWEGWCYAAQRIDLLIISISGAAVYIILETLKFSKLNAVNNLGVLKISGVAFMISIIINLASQITGKIANDKDCKMCQEHIDANDNPSEGQKTKISDYDQQAAIYTKFTNWMNSTSLIALFIGLMSLIIFFWMF
jgi:hypothetical protein